MLCKEYLYCPAALVFIISVLSIYSKCRIFLISSLIIEEKKA